MSGDILPAQAFKLQGEPTFNAGNQGEDRRIGRWDVCRKGEEGRRVFGCLEEGAGPLADDAVFPGLDRQRSLNEFVRLVVRDDESTTHEGGGKVCEGQSCDGGKSSGEAHVVRSRANVRLEGFSTWLRRLVRDHSWAFKCAWISFRSTQSMSLKTLRCRQREVTVR